MKSVLISIQPKWCELITNGKKTVEIRKSKPKLKTPFKCYIYSTLPQRKVIGEFICDEITYLSRRGYGDNFDYCYESLNIFGNDDIEPYITRIRKSCVSKNELNEYAKDCKWLFCWHISNLVVYDKPKELNEFIMPCNNYRFCETCAMYREHEKCGNKTLAISRPPQSWQYIQDGIQSWNG